MTATAASSAITCRPGLLAELRDLAQRVAPLECCGLLLGHGSHVATAEPVANVAAEPARHFELDPQALIDAHRQARAGGPQVLGYYHSHPGGLARPSPTDQAQAAGNGMVWAIIGSGDVTFWRDDRSGFTELPIAPGGS